jgi:hypothetical protein
VWYVAFIVPFAGCVVVFPGWLITCPKKESEKTGLINSAGFFSEKKYSLFAENGAIIPMKTPKSANIPIAIRNFFMTKFG